MNSFQSLKLITKEFSYFDKKSRIPLILALQDEDDALMQLYIKLQESCKVVLPHNKFTRHPRERLIPHITFARAKKITTVEEKLLEKLMGDITLNERYRFNQVLFMHYDPKTHLYIKENCW